MSGVGREAERKTQRERELTETPTKNSSVAILKISETQKQILIKREIFRMLISS